MSGACTEEGCAHLLQMMNPSCSTTGRKLTAAIALSLHGVGCAGALAQGLYLWESSVLVLCAAVPLIQAVECPRDLQMCLQPSKAAPRKETFSYHLFLLLEDKREGLMVLFPSALCKIFSLEEL